MMAAGAGLASDNIVWLDYGHSPFANEAAVPELVPVIDAAIGDA